jgi:hypothetical protein
MLLGQHHQQRPRGARRERGQRLEQQQPGDEAIVQREVHAVADIR